MVRPVWTIMTLTLPERAEMLGRLRARLLPQLIGKPVAWDVRYDEPGMPLGDQRERMRREAGGEYISNVDDDDLVAEDYVGAILPLLDGVDYIGFRLQAYEDRVALPKPTFHSLLCGGWFESAYGYHRDISHLNPMRRELALAVPMWGAFGEDSRWAGEMRAQGMVRTEHYVERVMYHYLSRPNKKDGRLSVRVTAGVCEGCGSESTVRVGVVKVCNACGAIS